MANSPTIELITPKEVAKMLGISVSSLYRYLSNGDVPFSRVHVGRGAVRFDKEQVVQYIESQTEVA